jgi:tetratricopeptide (TPR) repeat protein
LVDSRNRNLLWSRDYDGQRQHYLELVRSAAEGLRQALRPETAPLASDGSKASTDAELAYQRGFYNMRNYANRKQPEDFDHALADLKRALELDPTNARAAATIARLYGGPKLESGAPLSEVLPQIDQWAYKALQLDYRCGEAWQVLSVAEEMRPGGDKRKRLEYALKGAVYAPRSGYGHHVLGVALSRTSFTLSLKATEEAIKQDPLHLNGLLFRAGILSRDNRPKEGLQLIDQVLSIEPEMSLGILMKVWLLLRDHQYLEAEKLIAPVDKMVAEHRLHPGWVGFTHDWFDFEKNIAIKNKAEASTALQRLVSQARGEAPPFPRWESVTGTVLGMQAQYDSVDSTLETLSLRASKNIFEPYDWLLLNQEIEPIRKDKRFASLVERSKTEFEDMLKVLEEARARNEMPSYLESTLAQVRSLKIPSSK